MLSFQQNHLSETKSWPSCGYHSVCECPTEWSSDGVKDLFFDQLGIVTARISGSEFLIHVEIGMAMRDMQALDIGKCMVGWGMAGRNQMLRVIEHKSMS